MLLFSLTLCFFFFFNDTATTEIYTLSLHDALPISRPHRRAGGDHDDAGGHLPRDPAAGRHGDLAVPGDVARRDGAARRHDRRAVLLGDGQRHLNSGPEVVEQLNDMPVKEVNGAMVYIRDVAYVRDGAGVQTNIVRQNGQHGTYMSVLKNGSASSLAVVNRVKAILAALKPALPASLDIQVLVDQSLFVRASISGVIREAVIAACLTALMILL